MSDNEWYNEWKQVVQRVAASDKQMATSDNEWHNEWWQMAMSDSEWQQWYNERKRHSALQRMDITTFSITKTDTPLLQGMDGCN